MKLRHKMQRAPYVASACIILTLSTIASRAGAEKLEEVIVANYDDNHIGWDAGRMMINIPSNPPDNLIVEFRGQKRAKLDRLILKTKKWSVDLSKFVRDLDHPFPSRISVIVRKSISGNMLITLNLPFQPVHGPNGEFNCDAIEIAIENSVILSNITMTTPQDRCTF
jgi:hypothetical protein